jgi:hypothetical protein
MSEFHTLLQCLFHVSLTLKIHVTVERLKAGEDDRDVVEARRALSDTENLFQSTTAVIKDVS